MLSECLEMCSTCTQDVEAGGLLVHNQLGMHSTLSYCLGKKNYIYISASGFNRKLATKLRALVLKLEHTSELPE
jgi:hypothetical protein